MYCKSGTWLGLATVRSKDQTGSDPRFMGTDEVVPTTGTGCINQSGLLRLHERARKTGTDAVIFWLIWEQKTRSFSEREKAGPEEPDRLNCTVYVTHSNTNHT